MLTPSEAALRYGHIIDGKWANELQWCVTAVLTPDVTARLIKTATGNPTQHIYCNKDLAPLLLVGFDNVRARGLLVELHSFDGCYEIRKTRGEDQDSSHCWAAAFDINAATNRLGERGDMSDELGRCFTDAGLVWGRNFRRVDSMHFSLGF